MNRDLTKEFSTLKRLISSLKDNFSTSEIEANLIFYYLASNSNEDKKKFFEIDNFISEKLLILIDNTFNGSISLYDLAFIFEIIIDEETKSSNGIVFTPKFIANFIIENIFTNIEMQNDIKLLDPACGSSIFLLVALEIIHKKLKKSKIDIIENNLFGIDILDDNIRRSKILLKLACIDELLENNTINFNIITKNSLEVSWNKIFNISNFDFIIGNPPYVNPHDLDKNTQILLKKNFKTTKTGTTNIFYAFIEKSMDFINSNGKVSFIIPNNFLTINAAKDLRKFLKDNSYIDYILDFTENTVFKPIRTYNAIIVLSKTKKNTLHYSLIPLSKNLKNELTNFEILEIDYSHLNENKWNLVQRQVLENIHKIEHIGTPIKTMIKTGIATLKDKDYMIDYYDQDLNLFVKKYDTHLFYIEPEVVKPVFKISEVKSENLIENYQKYIIFPYKKSPENRNSIITEEELKNDFPKAYQYLLFIKPNLDTRDKGKPNPVAWYAYGRSQGINNVGRKLIYPTFSNTPKFSLVENEYTLFCNGYAIFETTDINLNILQKILNSSIMKYYVDNTSYSIEGGYMCYQKKYIENFCLPKFSNSELIFLMEENDKTAIDRFLINKYNLHL